MKDFINQDLMKKLIEEQEVIDKYSKAFIDINYMEDYIKQLGYSAIATLNVIRDIAEKFNLLDSQTYLDTLDAINELTID